MPSVVLLLALFALQTSAVLIAPHALFLSDMCTSTNIGTIPLAVPWCTAADPCTWTGVTCDSLGATVIERLDVVFDSSLALNGVLPESVTGLASLVEFRLFCANGFLTGTLPPEFLANNAASLINFTVEECPLLQGSLPAGSGAPLLELLRVRATSFSGTLDGVFVEQSLQLRELVLSRSDFSGVLPDTFVGHIHLSVVDFSSNKFSGLLPPTLCDLPSLERLIANQNYISEYSDCLGATLNPSIECNLLENFYCEDSPGDLGPCDALSKLGRTPDDICGVCGGRGDTCFGCDGVPNSNAEFDECGVCDGEGGPCYDCAGTLDGTLVYDLCGVCGGDNSTCADCEGTPNGPACYDDCDVCEGDSTSCADCYGMLFGTFVRDICGVCNGNGDTCADCEGTPAGGKIFDVCGVCGGDGVACLDCDGTVNGTASYDECDVCNGDGSSCGLAFIRAQEGTSRSSWFLIGLFVALVLCCLCPLVVLSVWMTERRAR